MTTEQFTYWLQGFIELNGGQMPTEEQWQSIKDHLQTVFIKITPPFYKPEHTKYCSYSSGVPDNPNSMFDQTNLAKLDPIDLNSITITC